ncbi:MAG: MotA/TolQ/ExbB proton channel family protein [Candidatus Dependentiae bacterium]|nr:MotA/TolQ/ExbB proton channel family protein [Candidatus Dependentiae bacterium]
MKFIFGNALWHLIMQSDLVSWIVLFVLLAMSVACWTLFLYKITMNRLKQKHIQELKQKLQSVRSVEELILLQREYARTVPGYFLGSVLTTIKEQLESNIVEQRPATEEQFQTIQQHLYQVIDDLVHQEESSISYLSTCAAVAPLLGLFGTVWGLVHAFIGISEKQAADIAAVAPGIAQALITTLAGLLVAIPAFVMFNYLAGKVRSFEQKLYGLQDRVSLLVQRLFFVR